MAYREFPPHPALARTIACYWRLHGAGRPALRNRVLPDGCFDLIFVLEAGPGRMAQGGHVIGPMTRGLLVTLTPLSSLFGVRFRPGVLSGRFGGSLERLLDRSVPADAVLGAALLAWEDEVASAPTDGARVAILDRLLLGWAPPSDVVAPVEAGLRLLGERAIAGAAGLSSDLGLGERTLQRLFRREVGFSPRLVARLLRFRRVVAELGRPDRPALATIAYRQGYADQAHLTREFGEFAGVSPTAYLAELASDGNVSETFKTDPLADRSLTS